MVTAHSASSSAIIGAQIARNDPAMPRQGATFPPPRQSTIARRWGSLAVIAWRRGWWRRWRRGRRGAGYCAQRTAGGGADRRTGTAAGRSADRSAGAGPDKAAAERALRRIIGVVAGRQPEQQREGGAR